MTNGPGRLPDAALDALETALAPVDGWIAARRAPASADGRPGHTVLVAADRAEPGVCAAWGRAALEALDEHAPGPVSLAMATGLPADEVETAWPELRRRLGRRPVEDLRIDLSAAGAGSAGDEGRATPAPGGPVAGVAAVPDGGAADDAAADDAADQAVRTLLAEVDDAGGPVRCGVLHRGLGASTRHLAVRALDRVVGGLAEAGGPPAGFRLTLPGAVHVDQVAAYSALLRVLEVVHDLPEDRLVFELRVDAPEAVLAADGTVPLRAMVDAAGTRCVGLHLDAVGYGAALGLPGAGGGARHV
ncbi:DUF6986 family protein, partial [Patulibacter minatonensis]|uniref:DUF6986 family protein n=1 Tax=Patulibacter minatonensis TaxID=298163 RepID=UPI00055B3471